jgi:hypothetical protein
VRPNVGVQPRPKAVGWNNWLDRIASHSLHPWKLMRRG